MWKNGKGDMGWGRWTTIKSNLVLTITEGTNVSNKLFRCFHVLNSWLLTTVLARVATALEMVKNSYSVTLVTFLEMLSQISSFFLFFYFLIILVTL